MPITLNGSGTITGVSSLATALVNPVVTTTMGVGNATPAASGAGITFPAAQSASTDANTLDDYEEGTWTPVLTPNTGTITSQSCSGSYVKIGKQVTLTFRAVITGGTVTAITSIGGFPFTTENINQQACGAARETQVGGLLWQIAAVGNTITAQMYNSTNGIGVTSSYGWSGSITYIT